MTTYKLHRFAGIMLRIAIILLFIALVSILNDSQETTEQIEDANQEIITIHSPK